MKRIYVKEEFCMGCGLCEVYCIVQHSISQDIVKAYKRKLHRPLSRLRVEEARPTCFTVQCRQCKNPPCVISCLSGAMHLDAETGSVMHDVEKLSLIHI